MSLRWCCGQIVSSLNQLKQQIQVILAGTLTEVQGDIRCKVLAALSTVQ